MESIFGVSINTILTILLSLLAICLAFGAWIALRHRVVFKMGIRNIPRRPAQTILIVIGLMLSTLIIAAAFTTGDTLSHSIRSEVYEILGRVDHLVVVATSDDGEAARPQAGLTIPEHLAADLTRDLAGNADITGIIPVHSERVPVLNTRTGLSEPTLSLVGVPAEGLEPFGNILDLDGNIVDIAELGTNGIVLGEKPAKNLDAEPGDVLIAFVYNQPHELTVVAISPDSLLLGYQDPGDPGGFAMPLERAQTIFERPGEVSYLAVATSGGIRDGAHLSEPVATAINNALDGTIFRAVPVKQQALEIAEETGSMFVTLFLAFGMFSIAVGILLIFLIFVMLAAERQPEMGMARAVGMRRRQLIQMFIAEGLGYDLASALVGALLGVGVAFIMVGVLSNMFGDFLNIKPTVTWKSLAASYALGVSVTFLTIVISSWRVSKLNIVAAIRNTPEPPRKRAGRRTMVYGILGIVAGVLLVALGISMHKEFPFSIGVSIIPFGMAIALRRFGLPARLVYTLASLVVLAYWLMPVGVQENLQPDLEGDIEMFVASGLMLVAATTMLIIWNATLVTRLIVLLGRRFSRWLPSVKIAVAYPLANRMRTGMTIAMFSLVVFSLVMIAAISSNLVNMLTGENAGGGWDIHAIQSPSNPIPDLVQALDEQGMDTSVILATGRLDTVTGSRTQVRQAGDTNWSEYNLNGMNVEFMRNSAAGFQTRAAGYDSDQAIWDALANDPHLAVIDSWALPTGGVTVSEASTLRLRGIRQNDSVMDPIPVEIRDPASGKMETVTIIGIIDSEVSVFEGLFISLDILNEVFAAPGYSAFVVALAPGADHVAVANEIESRLVNNGVQTISIKEMLEESAASSRASLTLFQGFMGLGLIVGIASLGVISFRSVVERRQQIGMLRAIGFSRKIVAASFIIESSMITLLGVVSGAILGVWLSWNLLTSDYFLGSGSQMNFNVPWGTVGFFVALSLGASLLMAYIPARQASRVPISHALRYE